ncbi:MAG: hypothetical protein HY784_18255, partial [Chloroflexi bacterium]|nr:hypothetical protein [Chloroflexota bacterium]
MKLRPTVAIAVAFGLLTLAGYFVGRPELIGLRLLFTDWAAILAAAALLLGLWNLLVVHWNKVAYQSSNWLYSIFLIIALLITFGLTAWQGAGGFASRWILNYVQTPVEGTLFALLSVVLLTAGFRLIRQKRNLLSLIFVVVAVLVLLGTGPLPGQNTAFLEQIRAWITQVPAVAGARGILLGVALGVIATGLRVLMGADRPYTD